MLYGNNLAYLLDDLGGAANFHIDLDNEIVRHALVVHEGRSSGRRRKRKRRPHPQSHRPLRRQQRPTAEDTRSSGAALAISIGVLVVALFAIGFVAPPAFLSHLTVFALACIVGWQVVWNVTPALHTPLMSVTNAISGIIVVGGMLAISGPPASTAVMLGAGAILLATINIAGGFLVTQRMLKMFRR